MHVLNGHFEGRKIVLDDPVPADLPPQAKVKITIEQPAGASKALAAIAGMAMEAPDLPRDLAENHDKYLYGNRKP